MWCILCLWNQLENSSYRFVPTLFRNVKFNPQKPEHNLTKNFKWRQCSGLQFLGINLLFTFVYYSLTSQITHPPSAKNNFNSGEYEVNIWICKMNVKIVGFILWLYSSLAMQVLNKVCRLRRTNALIHF